VNNLYRKKLLQRQNRSYTLGTVEFIHNQWVFFDDELDEATDLEFYTQQEVEVFRDQGWERGILESEGIVKTSYDKTNLKDTETIRIKKALIYSLEMLIEELSDDSFFQFLTSLNSLEFSLYDCIFCHNHLCFLEDRKIREGVNFLTFDNGETVCSVQHHFTYYKKQRDRFEFTLSTGKRIVIEKLE
jgi:hypothetical protein